jgi:hypothetical protein
MSNETVKFILQAIKEVASKAPELLSSYKYLPEKNNWIHTKWEAKFPLLTLKF